MNDLDARLRQQRNALDLAGVERPPLPEIDKRARRQRRDRYIAGTGSGLTAILVMLILVVSLTGGEEAPTTELDVADPAPITTTMNLERSETADVADQPLARESSPTAEASPTSPSPNAEPPSITGGSTTTTVLLNPDPSEPPALTLQPTDRTLEIRDATTLQVRASGQSPLAYQWYLDGVAIPGATTPTYRTPEHEQRNGSANYTAQYWAVITDRNGRQTTSRTASITVTPRDPDIDGNGFVGCEDVALLSANWQLDYKPADLDGNHIVDIFDLSRVSAAFNDPQGSESCE